MCVGIGVDVGGTRIAAGAVGDSGEVLALVRKPTPVSSSNTVADTIGEYVKRLVGSYDVEAIGIGAVGFVDRECITVVLVPNLTWRNKLLAEKVSQTTGYRVVVENDANAAAWEEFKFGTANRHSSAVVVTMGTGTGGGVIVDDALLHGIGEFVGEIGHIMVNPGGQRCGCSVFKCWETQTSGTALVRIVRQLAAGSPVYGARMLKLAGDREITGLDVTRAVQADNPAALEYFAETAEWIGVGMATLNTVIDPEVFVPAGGVSESGDLLAVLTCISSEKSLTAEEFCPAPLVELAILGNNAGIIGVADLAKR